MQNAIIYINKRFAINNSVLSWFLGPRNRTWAILFKFFKVNMTNVFHQLACVQVKFQWKHVFYISFYKLLVPLWHFVTKKGCWTPSHGVWQQWFNSSTELKLSPAPRQNVLNWWPTLSSSMLLPTWTFLHTCFHIAVQENSNSKKAGMLHNGTYCLCNSRSTGLIFDHVVPK